MGSKAKPVEGYKLIICKKIDKYLTETGMYNKDFGALFGVTEGNVRAWRTGKTALDVNQVVILMEFWNVSFEELVDIKK